MLIFFIRPLSTNKNTEDAIKGNYIEINVRQNNVA